MIAALLGAPGTLIRAAEAARGTACPDAAQSLADIVRDVAGRSDTPRTGEESGPARPIVRLEAAE